MTMYRTIPTALLLAALPTAALAAGGHGFVFEEHGYYIINFLVLLGALVFVGRKPLSRFLVRRSESLQHEIAEAERLQKEARATLVEYERRLAQLDSEIDAIRDRAREDAEGIKARIVADGEALARKLLEDAEARVRQETSLLRAKLEAELAAEVVARAEALVKAGLNPPRQRQFVNEYVQRVEQLAETKGEDGRGRLQL